MIRISDAEFEQVVERAIDSIPPALRKHLDNVMIEIRTRPDRKLMQDFDVPDDILGLYIGCPLDERGIDSATVPLPDRVLIFRDNLCEMCESRAELIEEIRITVLHEIGHHFGLDEDRLEELGYD